MIGWIMKKFLKNFDMRIYEREEVAMIFNSCSTKEELIYTATVFSDLKREYGEEIPEYKSY